MALHDRLRDPTLLVVLAYAPAGLGHLRVADALRHGLSAATPVVLFPEPTAAIGWVHRLTTVWGVGQSLMVWAQYGWRERLVTGILRRFFWSSAPKLLGDFLSILKQQVQKPKTVLLIATHFGLAHQFSAIRKEIESAGNIRLRIVVCVTDDSPQAIWYVPGVEAITVPSQLTKTVLDGVGRRTSGHRSTCFVCPYPVSPLLSTTMADALYRHRKQQVRTGTAQGECQVLVPISGAAAGIGYLSSTLLTIRRADQHLRCTIVARETLATQFFLHSMRTQSWSTVYSSPSSRECIELYEHAHDVTIHAIEITKPSEQAFKALLSPRMVGGVILLFAPPVGRQEYDNLDFLRRHGLLPTEEQQESLHTLARHGRDLTAFTHAESVHSWRGLVLPEEPEAAAQFFRWCRLSGIFARMMEWHPPVHGGRSSIEISPSGVEEFWKIAARTLQ